MHEYTFRVLIFIATILVNYLHALTEKPNMAVVIAPIVEASGSALSEFSKCHVARYYEEFPCAPDKGWHSCLRMHQLKCNEVVTIKPGRCTKEELECEVSNLFALDGGQKKRSNFWLLRKQVIPLKHLAGKINLSLIPEPIDMCRSPIEYNCNVLTLTDPWFDKKIAKKYSAGTRFVRCKERDTKNSYAVYSIDYERCCVKTSLVPKELALVEYAQTEEDCRVQMLKILKRWAHPQDGFIPYVYGGSTYVARCKNDSFAKLLGKRCGYKATYWQRHDHTIYPMAGFDCSGMLLTAAQIVGLPYFLKNTRTINSCLKSFTKNDTLQEGDLIWYFGHIMIVSDINNNLLIEAAGYEAGYGKVHEISVNKVFAGIEDYKGLLQAYRSKRFLKRLNSKGRPFRSVYRLTLLKLV